MAEVNDPLARLEEDHMSCAVCFEPYTDPRALPCLHVFCRTCLEGVPLVRSREDAGDQQQLGCPICRKLTPLPLKGVSGFPVSFIHSNLADFVKRERSSKPPQPPVKKCDHCNRSDSTVDYCYDCESLYCKNCAAMHKDCEKMEPDYDPPPKAPAIPPRENAPEPVELCDMHRKALDVFCEACQSIICKTCVQKKPHKNHAGSCVPVTEMQAKYRDLLQDRLKPLHRQIEFVDHCLKPFSLRESEISEQGDVVKSQIHSKAEELVNSIRETEEILVGEADHVTKAKLEALDKRRKYIEEVLEDLKTIKDSMELHLKTGNNKKIVKNAKTWVQRIEEEVSGVDISKLRPSEVADLSFVPANTSTLSLQLGNLSSTFEGSEPSCDIKMVEKFLFLDKSAKVSLVFFLQYTRLPAVVIPLQSIKCKIHPPPNATKGIAATVHHGDTPKQYVIKFCPSCNGYYQVNIRVEDVELEPQSLLIPFNPLYFSCITPTKTFKTKCRPLGLAVAEDKRMVMVTDAKEVTVLDCDGNQIRQFDHTNGGWVRFRCATITKDNHILLTDPHGIMKLTMEGKVLASVGSKGTGNLQFNSPFGITVNERTGLIYIADLRNHRIQVLNPDLTFAFMFGSRGKAFGQFHDPNGMAFDSKGNLFITDTFNHRVQKFTPEGKYLSHFGSEGSHSGQLNLPEKIVIDNDYVYVTEHLNARVSVFTNEGEFVRVFGNASNEGGLLWPRGICFDSEGSLYICDYKTYRIVKY